MKIKTLFKTLLQKYSLAMIVNACRDGSLFKTKLVNNDKILSLCNFKKSTKTIVVLKKQRLLQRPLRQSFEN